MRFLKEEQCLLNIPNHKICSTFIKYIWNKITMICDTIEIAKSNISINFDPFPPDFITDSNFPRNYSFSNVYRF